DVSVLWVCLICSMYSNRCTILLKIVGFPIRKSSDQFTYNSPRHIGVSPVLHRLLVPRHSPCALDHLTKLTNFIQLPVTHNKVAHFFHPSDIIDIVDYLALIYISRYKKKIKYSKKKYHDFCEIYSLKTEQTVLNISRPESCSVNLALSPND